MKANEQGLTTEERIMFAVLGIILVIAIGVLTINYFSKHDRNLDNAKNTATEKGEQQDVGDKDKTNTSEDYLIEVANDNSKITNKGLPKVIKTSASQSKSKAKTTTNTSSTKEDTDSDEEGTGDTGEIDEEAAVLKPDENLDWTFNSTIVKESYANEEITVPTTVTLTDGTEKEAQVVLKNNDTNEEVTIVDGKVSLPAGKYTYYYTCNNSTKELPLTVYNKLDDTKITIASVKDTYNDYSEDLEYLISNSSITGEKNNFKLKVVRRTTINVIPLKVTLANSYNKVETSKTTTTYCLVSSSTEGITVSNDENIASLNDNEFIILLDLNKFSLTKTNKILLTIDGIEYLYNIDISVENKVEEADPEPEDEESTEEQNQEEQEPEKEQEEEEPKTEPDPEPTPEDPPVEENNNTESETNESPTNNIVENEVEETPPDISLTT